MSTLQLSLLEIRFPNGLAELRQLFGTTCIDRELTRLNEVYAYTEGKWRGYVDQIPGGALIKYLLIAEAPPGTFSTPPPYFLDPKAKPRTLMRAVSKAFFGHLVYKHDGTARTLAALAREGFLMVDSIPFAMKYTSRRSRATYAQLVAQTANAYMLGKLADSSLSWSTDLRIAFSVPWNARCVIRALQGRLKVGGMNFVLSEDMIAVGGSNYPEANTLRSVFHLA